MSAFELTVQHLDGHAVHIRMSGALDLAHAYRFDEALRRAENDGADPIVVDLSRIDFLDSTGISRLVAARRRARRCGRRLVLVRGSAVVQRLFTVVALEEHFEIVHDVSVVVGPRADR
jgi:anti-sigma B factor antagonist